MWRRILQAFRLLILPGLELKRWILLFTLGLVILSLGLAYLFVSLYRTVDVPEVGATLTLQFIPRWLRGIIFVTCGVLVALVGFWKLNKSILDAMRPAGGQSIVDTLVNFRMRQRGPKVVAIGGGTGLSTLLRGIKSRTSNVTAIVTVADDGGSSGRLRRELGVLPPGDFRNCIVALADAEPLMSRLFQYRFGQGSGLDGHSFGNLFIVAMSGITGNFEEAIRESCRVLAVRGQIIPSTLENVTLCAELVDEIHVQGESKISESTQAIKRVYLIPERADAFPDAVKSILDAEIVIVGPGSLYTSVLPNLLVEGVKKAILSTDATKVYVCNVATQAGETDGFQAEDHVAALVRHFGRNPFDYIVVNSARHREIPEEWRVSEVSAQGFDGFGSQVVLADVVDPSNPLRHDPEKLAVTLLSLARTSTESSVASEAPSPTY
ncbi:MAG: uridine diphosphate-N-acetylglucosamine-binding protein YvcK [Chloroflexota bacterium]